MTNGYADDLTIDRIDNNGNYCPENCRWVSWHDQCNNKRHTIRVKLGSDEHTLKEWSDIIGVNYFTLYSRYKTGKAPEEILKEGAL